MVNPVSNTSAQALNIQADRRQKAASQAIQNTQAAQPPPDAGNVRQKESGRAFRLPPQPVAQQTGAKEQSKVDIKA
jgi:hypothetical protein